MPLQKLNQKAIGLSLGIVFALALITLVLGEVLFNIGGEWINVISDVYVGYDITFLGTILGIIYGLIDGFISGWIFAWLYNRLS